MSQSISIITVCMNAAASIERTLNSVLEQSHPVDQYIIIDGGSTDGTIEIIKSYEAKFAGRLHWTSEPDKGIFDAMNKGLKAALCDVIGILNADDWYEKDAVAQVLKTADAHPPGVYYGMMRKWQNGMERSVVREHHNFLWQDMLPHPATFIHTDIYKEKGHFKSEYQLAADYELMLRLSNQNVPFYPIDAILTNFSSGGASEKRARKMWLETIKIRRDYKTLSFAQYAVFRLLIEARSFVEKYLLKEKM